jgi:thymidylate kinase
MHAERGGLYFLEGLDASGKSTLAQNLAHEFNGVLTHCPPDWMRPFRKHFNEAKNSNVRLLYYAFSNIWVDRMVVQPALKENNRDVFQDRTLLTTLTAHESMGASPFWMNIWTNIGKLTTKPSLAFLIHVDNKEREERMMKRDVITSDDLESLKNQDTMEQNYLRWAKILDWNIQMFDNTHHTPQSATTSLSATINLSKGR